MVRRFIYLLPVSAVSNSYSPVYNNQQHDYLSTVNNISSGHKTLMNIVSLGMKTAEYLNLL